MVGLEAFICVLAHKEKTADTTSETKAQPEKRVVMVFVNMRNLSSLITASTRGSSSRNNSQIL